jgi:hypothetical protein
VRYSYKVYEDGTYKIYDGYSYEPGTYKIYDGEPISESSSSLTESISSSSSSSSSIITSSSSSSSYNYSSSSSSSSSSTSSSSEIENRTCKEQLLALLKDLFSYLNLDLYLDTAHQDANYPIYIVKIDDNKTTYIDKFIKEYNFKILIYDYSYINVINSAVEIETILEQQTDCIKLKNEVGPRFKREYNNHNIYEVIQYYSYMCN